MSYQVLARKWRPATFEQMVGQGHVLRALANALDQERLHHAYLLSGTRGVGKTTLGRIFAKCLNCETGITSTPCGKCEACRDVDAGRFVDLIEVDAASRTGVDDTRELLDNVQYTPARGRYKVYLIDEVHMLSTHSFNALLKTLEEPPPHVKFLLATTEPQKLPVTVLSRCLQFNLKRLSPAMISDYLGRVLEAEETPFDTEALELLARAADGSMRDALSLLDQAISFGDGVVRATEVTEMLGWAPRAALLGLVRAVGERDATRVLGATAALAEQGVDLEGVLGDLADSFYRAAVIRQAPELASSVYADDALAKSLAASFSEEDIQLHYQIALHGRRDFPWAPDPRSGLEMTLLRMLAFRPFEQPADYPRARPAAVPAAVSEPPGPENGSHGAIHKKSEAGPAQPSRVELKHQAPGSVQSTPVGPREPDRETDWPTLMTRLGLKGVAYALASNCSAAGREGDVFRLVLEEQHSGLRTVNAEQRLGQALRDCLGESVRLRIETGTHGSDTPAEVARRDQAARQQSAVQSVEEDPLVKGLQASFGARIVPDSIEPID
ncbi:MAG: DNA polymerase III subunit gamma/tau [Pseudomonadota bacterium]|nr:DNA polymerase III subunit gamma/tau [Pseudomonadota bacterium]